MAANARNQNGNPNANALEQNKLMTAEELERIVNGVGNASAVGQSLGVVAVDD